MGRKRHIKSTDETTCFITDCVDHKRKSYKNDCKEKKHLIVKKYKDESSSSSSSSSSSDSSSSSESYKSSSSSRSNSPYSSEEVVYKQRKHKETEEYYDEPSEQVEEYVSEVIEKVKKVVEHKHKHQHCEPSSSHKIIPICESTSTNHCNPCESTSSCHPDCSLNYIISTLIGPAGPTGPASPITNIIPYSTNIIYSNGEFIAQLGFGNSHILSNPSLDIGWIAPVDGSVEKITLRLDAFNVFNPNNSYKIAFSLLQYDQFGGAIVTLLGDLTYVGTDTNFQYLHYDNPIPVLANDKLVLRVLVMGDPMNFLENVSIPISGSLYFKQN